MTDRLTIGFDAKRIVRNATGLGSYSRTLVNDLAQNEALQLRLYAPDPGREELRQQVVGKPNVTFCYAPPSRLPFQRQLWRNRRIVRDLVADHVDVYHGLSGELPAGISRSGIKSVVTIHDLIFLRHPEFYADVDAWIYHRKFQRTIREADRIIAISECTRRDIMELGSVDSSKIELVYQSCAPRFSTDIAPVQLQEVNHRYELPERYVLSVGSIEERKNILLAVRALAYLPDDVHLVAVGRSTGYSRHVERIARREPYGPRVHFLHGVPDKDLPAIYAQAETFVYPSRYEGFGIPIIEAISCGLPVVACTGSCLEEAGGPDGLYAGPDDVEGLAAAIKQMLCGAEGRAERICRSQNYIRRFENTHAAEQVSNIYRSLRQ